MYSPIGFVPFDVIAIHARDRAMNYWFDPGLSLLPHENSEWGNRLGASGWQLFQYWLVDHCLYQQPYPIFASNPSGNVIRLSSQAFQAPHQLSYESLEWPLPDDSELAFRLSRMDPEAPYLQDFLWVMVEPWTWHIRAPDPEIITRLEELYYFSLQGAARLLQPFEGWALCVREGDVSSFKRHIDHLFDWGTEEAPAARPGRPRKREVVARIYWQLFPKGHEAHGRTFKQALREVNAAAGMNCALDTLQRGLADMKLTSPLDNSTQNPPQ